MLKRIHLIMATAVCGLTLGLLSTPCADAEPNVLLSGRAGTGADVLVWVDTDKGTQVDGKAAKALRQQFAGTDWNALDNNQVIISKDGKPLVSAVYRSNNDNTFFMFHSRAGNQIADGWIIVRDEDAGEGFGVVYITELANDGRSSRTARIVVQLNFTQE
jgi:hypothetical protein